MSRSLFSLWLAFALAGAAARVTGAELKFDFSAVPEHATPPGFRSVLVGQGPPGEWQVLLADFPSALKPYGAEAPNTSRRKVIAQLASDPTDERFPLLVYEGTTFTDFTVTTRFKAVAGQAERMAGIAFRYQDPKNFYVVRASSLGGNVRFYKVVDGVRSAPIGNEIAVPADTWLTLKITCRGNHIRAWLNDTEVVPELTDTSFNKGRLAFWTKSDSVSWFADTVIDYVPREVPADALVRAVMKDHPKLPGLKLFAAVGEPRQLKVIASKDAADVGQPGGANEQEVLDQGSILCRRDKDSVTVLMPLRDRNGDVLAAVRLLLPTFPGQTEQNAFTRAQPIVKGLQKNVRERKDLIED
jgi:hypothetical protein